MVQRARGWSLWKALITVNSLKDKQSPKALIQHEVIKNLIHN